MMNCKTPQEVELMRESALLVSKTLSIIAARLRPGITTLMLDREIGTIIRDNGAIPSFLNYRGYPFNSCISSNDVVVHGFPNENELRQGDILSIDIGVILNGWHGDSSRMYAAGAPSTRARNLIDITYDALMHGVKRAMHHFKFVAVRQEAL